MSISEERMEYIRKVLLAIFVAVLLTWTVWLAAGCRTYQPTQADLDQAETVAAQIEAKDSIIDSLQWHIQDIRTQLGSVMDPAERVELEHQMDQMASKLDEIADERAGLVERVDNILDPETPDAERIGDIGAVVSSFLPWPFNAIGMAVLAALGWNERRKGMRNMAGLTLAIERSRDRENGGLNMSRFVEMQNDLGVRGVVNRVLDKQGLLNRTQ